MSRLREFIKVLREYQAHPITYRLLQAYRIAIQGLPF